MAFTYDDTDPLDPKIIQSGVEVNLFNAIGLTGVSVDPSSTKFTLSGVRFVQEGDLIIDSEVNELIFDSTCNYPHYTRKTGSVLQIGTKKITNGIVSYSKGSAITSTRVSTGGAPTFDMDLYGLMSCEDNTTFKAYGGVFNTPSSLALAGSHALKGGTATLDVEELTVNNTIPTSGGFSNRLLALYFNESTSVVTNLNIKVTGVNAPFEIRNDKGLSNASFELGYSSINTDFQSDTAKSFKNMILANNQNNYDARLRVSPFGAEFYDTYLNNDIGSEMSVDMGSNDRKGQLVIKHSINITSKKSDGSNVDAVFYLADNVGSNAVSTYPNPTIIDFTTQFTYTDLASGGNAALEIYTAFFHKVQNAVPLLHYRSNSGSNAGDYTVFGYSYLTNFLELPVTAKGNRGVDINAPFVDNSLITEKDPLLVNAYLITIVLVSNVLTVTGDSNTLQNLTAKQLYDAICNYMRLNFTGVDIRVNRIEDTIDAVLNDINIVLDYITFDGSIKLNSSKTLTLLNGSTVSGNYFDSTQDSSLIKVGGGNIKVYNPLDNNLIYEGGNYAFLFSSISVNPVKVVDGTLDEGTIKTVTLIQGANEVDFSTAGSITALGNKVDTTSEETQLRIDLARDKIIDRVESVKE